jgi:hypothetical protein
MDLAAQELTKMSAEKPPAEQPAQAKIHGAPESKSKMQDYNEKAHEKPPPSKKPIIKSTELANPLKKPPAKEEGKTKKQAIPASTKPHHIDKSLEVRNKVDMLTKIIINKYMEHTKEALEQEDFANMMKEMKKVNVLQL